MSLWRRPGTKTFQLVHRSQRDPLINDPEASDRVLKEIVTSQRKGKAPAAASHDRLEEFASNEADFGDAAAYGIYFDDTDYDYMQHLRTVGAASDAYLVEAPPTRKGKAKRTGEPDLELRESSETVAREAIALPEEALPSHPLDEATYLEVTAGKAGARGLQPDLDPRIREVLEALDDEAYAVDDGEGSEGEDEFFGSIIKGGEIDEDDWEQGSDNRDGAAATTSLGDVDAVDDSLEARVARFKATKLSDDGRSDDEFDSEAGDTIAELKASSTRRPQRNNHNNKSVSGSQFSMSSSAMFRNEGLRNLDDQFDQIEKMYDEESEDSWDDEDEYDEEPPALVSGREDLDEILDDFLSRYEVLGGKMKPVLESAPGTEGNMGKLNAIRRELSRLEVGDDDPQAKEKQAEKERILSAVRRQQKEERTRKDRIDVAYTQPKERWDCETVLSTYSNVSNHPRMLRMRDLGPRPAQIRVNERTGFPVVIEEASCARPDDAEGDEDENDEDDDGEHVVRETVKRPKGETPEERKARKEAVKQERASRREQKKSTKQAFSSEFKRQKKIAGKAVAGGAAADVKGEGVRRLA